MKIIHCSDLHLDSPMVTSLDANKRRQRRGELLETFGRMVDYAESNGVRAVLVCGDLFDVKAPSAAARRFVRDEIASHGDIRFFYIKGNHDSLGLADVGAGRPDNLVTFSDRWESHRIHDESGFDVVISGVEAGADGGFDPDLPEWSGDDKNIVMLHGQLSDYPSAEKAEIIDLGAYRNRHIDYLALGHIHEFRRGELSPGGVWCYSGCLEGRGFDECGPKGFVLLDVGEGSVETEFIPFAKRGIHNIEVDATGAEDMTEISERAALALAGSGATADDLVKVSIVGEVPVECEVDLRRLEIAFSRNYYAFRAKDATRIGVDYDSYEKDASLKGEFVRLIEADTSLSDDEKARVVRMGIAALSLEGPAL
ncbi:MAG: DNA repair exonuclease [Eubacterium sp.]|nr:DNA repair exonuclease [Eubacterium sp.]